VSPVAAFPRIPLGHWPTPLEPCHRLREEIGGPLIWLKRDDCSGLAFGGNKTRKLEFLLGEACEQGATGVVTFGAVQSNHARQTAAACARIGLPCDLVLTNAVDRTTGHYRTSGNRMLDDVLGATVHEVADDEAALGCAAELAEADPGRYFIDPGGSSAVGALGYVAAAGELAGQLVDVGVDPAEIVVASSTGGTAAGLVVGLHVAGVDALDAVVRAVAVYADHDHTRGAIDRLVASTSELLGVDPAPADRVVVTERSLGAGYGIETAASHAAIHALARAEGVLLDPVYTAKAFADLVGSIGDLDPAGDVVFVHTGGQAGLFAYADEFSPD
jgi:D-cysteine desulfhydrase family pyridoxal phosphate-dependent enzyme